MENKKEKVKKIKNFIFTISLYFKSEQMRKVLLEDKEKKEKVYLYKKQVFEEVQNLLFNSNIYASYEQMQRHLIQIYEIEEHGYKLTNEQKRKKDELIGKNFLEIDIPFNYLSTQNYIDIIKEQIYNLGVSIEGNKKKQEKVKNKIKMIDGLALKYPKENYSSKRQEELKVLEKLEKYNVVLNKLNDKIFFDTYVELIKDNLVNTTDCVSSNDIHILKLLCDEHYSSNEQEKLNFWFNLQNYIKINKKKIVLFKKWLDEIGVIVNLIEKTKDNLTIIDKVKLAYSSGDILTDVKSIEGYNKVYGIEDRIVKIQDSITRYMRDNEVDIQSRKRQEILLNTLKNAMKNYFNIEERFRDTIKDEKGKTATDLLEENFIIIEKSIEQMSQSINQKRLKLLSKDTDINKRHLQQME